VADSDCLERSITVPHVPLSGIKYLLRSISSIIFKMYRSVQLSTLLSLASLGLAQLPAIIPFSVVGGLDG
jgi:hypothetical protein